MQPAFPLSSFSVSYQDALWVPLGLLRRLGSSQQGCVRSRLVESVGRQLGFPADWLLFFPLLTHLLPSSLFTAWGL